MPSGETERCLQKLRKVGQHAVDNPTSSRSSSCTREQPAGGRNNTCGIPGGPPSLHLTSRSALDKVATSGGGEGLRAVALAGVEMGLEAEEQASGNLELVRFDFTGDLLGNLEEYERAVLVRT